MKKDKIITISIILIIIIVVYFSFIVYVGFHEEEEEEIIYVYEILATFPTESDSIFLIPIPMIESEKMFDISDYEVKEGKVSMRYTNSTYGSSLEIITNNSFLIEGKKTTEPLTHLTMEKDNVTINDPLFWGKHYFWIFMNSTENVTPYVNIICKKDNFGIEFPYVHANGYLYNGWQLIEGEYSEARA